MKYALQKWLKYLLPFLLCLLFVLLALVDTKEAAAPKSTASIEVPFTCQAVENYLALAGFSWDGTNVTLSTGSQRSVGTLTVTSHEVEEGEMAEPYLLTFTAEIVGDISDLEGENGYEYLQKIKERDAEDLREVYKALMQAMAPAYAFTEKQQDKGLERLNRCLEKTHAYSYTLKGWIFSFTSTDDDALRTLTFTLRKEGH